MKPKRQRTESQKAVLGSGDAQEEPHNFTVDRARLAGMVNRSELLKKHRNVRMSRRKFTGSGQKGKAGGQLTDFLSCTDNNPAGVVTEPNPAVLNKRNKVNPIASPVGASRSREELKASGQRIPQKAKGHL